MNNNTETKTYTAAEMIDFALWFDNGPYLAMYDGEYENVLTREVFTKEQLLKIWEESKK